MKEKQMFLEAEEADLVRARIRIAWNLSGKAHLKQRVLSWTGLKTQLREDKVKALNNLE